MHNHLLTKLWMSTGSDNLPSASSTTAPTTKTLAPGSHLSELEIKKSRFLGYASHVESWDQAQAYIDQIKAEHPKGRHWCYGVCTGTNPVSERCSDDGEPTGTAGVPILGAIRGEDLSDTVVVVVRYFGGIKLGAGGLIRAYGGAARQVLREAPVDILIPKATIRVQVDGSHIGTIYDTVSKLSGSTSGEEYGADGSLTVSITVDLSNEAQLRQTLMDATRGEVIYLDESQNES